MFYNIFITTLFFITFYILLEVIKRKTSLTTYFTRKTAHIMTGVGAIVASYFLDKNEFMFTVFIFALLFILIKRFNLLHSIHMSKSIGENLYPIGLLLIAHFLYIDKPKFIVGVFILALSDALASMIGKKFDPFSKTLVGSLVHFIVTLILLLFVLPLPLAIPFAAALSFVENISGYGLDNLTVPLTYVILLILLKNFGIVNL